MNLSKGDILSLLAEGGEELFARADAVRRREKGEFVEVRALLEFSNHCRRLCRYCGLNAENRKLPRFRLDPSEIVSLSQEAARAGYRTVVLQSGEDRSYSPEAIGEMVHKIKKSGCAVTLSCGEWPREVYAHWRACGADRYLLKHETADPALYRALHPDSTLSARLRCLRDLKELGYETGGGFMVGLPGETPETVADNLLLLQTIGCDMAGIGPFLPHPDTALRDAPPGSGELTRRAVAVARLLLPRANLPATTALTVLEGDRSVFSCGANVVMKKITPGPCKKLYQIYPADFPDADIPQGRREVEAEIRSYGRTPR